MSKSRRLCQLDCIPDNARHAAPNAYVAVTAVPHDQVLALLLK